MQRKRSFCPSPTRRNLSGRPGRGNGVISRLGDPADRSNDPGALAIGRVARQWLQLVSQSVLSALILRRNIQPGIAQHEFLHGVEKLDLVVYSGTE